MNSNPKPFANTPVFYTALGWFYAVWSATELNIDCAIGKLKNISPEQTHTLVAKLNFGPKVEMLRSLLPTSDYQNVPELEEFLTRIEEESLRNVFAHSFLASDPQSVTFVHRPSKRNDSATAYQFTVDGFLTHVQNFVQLSHDFEKALGFTHKQVADFAAAALPEKNG